jgi:hypothetical protein
MKTLYFEGAGMNYEANEYSDVCNYRPRTAFTNNNGQKIFIELGHCARYNKHLKPVFEWALYISHAFYITDDPDNDDCNKNRIAFDWQDIRANYTFTKKDITKIINKVCKADFDTIEVLSDFYGYRVFEQDRTVNLIDNHIVNKDRADTREAAFNLVDKRYRSLLNSKYSVISLISMEDESIKIRCYASDEELKKAGITERIQQIDCKQELINSNVNDYKSIFHLA